MRYIKIILPILLLVGCSERIEPQNRPVDIFETLWTDFNEHYAVSAEHGVDWDVLYAKYRPMVADDISSDSLWNVLASMIYETEDGHVTLDNPNAVGGKVSINGYEKAERPANYYYRSAVDAALPSPTQSINAQLNWGEIPADDIGYIYLGSLSKDEYAIEDIDMLVSKVAKYRSIIIDLRDGVGGYPPYGFRLASWFAPSSYLAYYTQDKSGPGPDDFGEKFPLYAYTQPNNYADKNIVLLTNGRTFSSHEHFLLIAEGFTSAIQIGTRTVGCYAAASFPRFLPNGWTYRFSTERIVRPDGISPEGQGSTPDIEVANSNSGEAKVNDKVLTEAINYLRGI